MKITKKIFVLWVMLIASMQMMAGSHGIHYGKVTVSVSPTGNGTVYIGTTNTDTSGETTETWNCGGDSGNDSKTFYLFAKANDGYVFKEWSGDGSSTVNSFSVTIKAEGSEGSPTSKTYTANFVEMDSWHKMSSAPAAGNFYIYNPYSHVFLKKTNEVTTDPLDATKFTLSGSTNCSISYDNGTNYISENKGGQNWGTATTNWTISANNGGYYLMHHSDYDRYLNYTGSVLNYIRQDFTNDNRTWVFIPEAKMVEYIQNTASFDAPVNLTSLIVNPGYEASTWSDGWTGTGDNKEVAFAKNDNHTIYAEMWVGAAVGGKVYQTINNLPKGYYRLSASTAGDALNSVYAQVGEHIYQQAKGEGDWNRTSVVFRIDEEQANVEIGYLRPDNVWWWSAVDDFQLEYLGTNPTYEYNNGIRLDGSYLSKPAYTSIPADGVDPTHSNDALLVVTWRDNSTTDPTDLVNPIYKLKAGSTAEVWVDGAKLTDVDLLSDFRSSHYDNGFGLYIPNFDEAKTYTVKVPANVFGYTQVGHGNEAFEVEAVASPIKDGKYFIRVAGTTKHVSRGGHYGTQAILDNYGVPVLVQTAGLTVFKFLDNNAFLGNDPGADDMYTDCFDEKTRRYNLIPDDEENPTKVKFFTPARNKYLYHADDAINDVAYEKLSEGDQGDWYDFEPFTAEGYQAHLLGIEDAEAQRVAERAGLSVSTYEEYNKLIAGLEKENVSQIWPNLEEEDEVTASQAYHEARNNALPVEPVWEPAPKDLIGAGERLTLTLDKGLYCANLNAFQQASALAGLQQNLGFRGLVYYYAKVGDVMSKSQLKSITETTGSIPTTEEGAKAALTGDNYLSKIVFYVPANGTNVEFGVQNPQRLGNDIDERADSWVAFQNLKIEKFDKFDDVVEAVLSCKAGKYGTFVAPFEVTLPTGISAYTAGVEENSTEVTLTDLLTKIVPANTPVVLHNSTDENVSKTISGIDTREEVDGVKPYSVLSENGALLGFYTDKSNNGDALTLTGNGHTYVLQTKTDGRQAFFIIGEGKTFEISKNKCYLITPSNTGAQTIRLGFDDFDEDETAIENILNNEQTTIIYDLSGRRVNGIAKGGIYIINGKKVVK